MQETNTENEEAYVRRIEDICERERIDTIFPSSDAEVYVSLQEQAAVRAARRRVLLVQDYETLSIPLDKFETNQAAKGSDYPLQTRSSPTLQSRSAHLQSASIHRGW